jgi:hypothetical protein
LKEQIPKINQTSMTKADISSDFSDIFKEHLDTPHREVSV